MKTHFAEGFFDLAFSIVQDAKIKTLLNTNRILIGTNLYSRLDPTTLGNR